MIENLKIIEISSVLAGPSVGMFFAELGAEVIKIENKLSGGDITRKWHLTIEDSNNQSAYFSSVNWGKKHLFLDLNNKSDIKKLTTLVKSSNVIITNFKHGDAQKFNLTFKDCKKINNKIIYANLGGFKSAPKRVAFDAIIQAETGFISINGESRENCIVIGGLWMRGKKTDDVNVQDLTLRKSKWIVVQYLLNSYVIVILE